uniref:Putative structural protein n=1 Tax=viral metagenome TaxID=1070528 RepID=A0A6M3IJE2_9ZZZZ
MPLNSPSYPDVLEEGVLVKSRTKINFIGDAVTATDDPTNAKVDITVGDAVTAVAAVEAAGLTFAENKGIILDAALSADEKWSGIVEAGVAGAILAFGDLVYFAVADSKWELTDANAAATAFGKIGICVLAAAENAATVILLFGKVRADAAFPALTIGAPVHIGEVAGDIVVAAPVTASAIVRIIGYGNTADELFFCPDNTYLELA